MGLLLLFAGLAILLTARDYYETAAPAYARQAEVASGMRSGALSRAAAAYCRAGALLDVALGCVVALAAIAFGTASLI